MQRKDRILLVILCVISLAIGFGVGKIQERSMWQTKFNQVVKSELDWLKSQLDTSCLLSERAYNISGVVIEKGNNLLIVEIKLDNEELAKQNVNVNVTEETEIFRVATTEPSSEEPQKISLNFEDIKKDDYILIVSEESTIGKTEITANKIQISSLALNQ